MELGRHRGEWSLEGQVGLLRLHPTDNVAIALRDISKGEAVSFGSGTVVADESVSVGHKMALKDLRDGELVMKYGSPIGHATSDVKQGAWMHSHNIKTNLSGKLEYQYRPEERKELRNVEDLQDTFLGYVREDKSVGIRNEIWIINTVGCINKTAERLAQMADRKFQSDAIDGVFHFAHPYGCSQLGDDLLYTQELLAALVRHPNAAGVLVMGLGCENNRIGEFGKLLGDYPSQRVKFMNVQDTDDEFTVGMEKLAELAEYAKTFRRTPVPISLLKVGLKCGGSDGFSGITANPLVGAVSDLLVGQGATTLLTEVPEMFGAETLLMNRATDEETFQKIVSLINDFKDYYIRHNQVIYENPSPGNKDGGITTLEEKSLGCTQKGGTSAVVDVQPYAKQVTKHGLNLVSAPGNDMVSVTALAAAGAHMVLFTTGRGTPLGGAVPTVKVSTNSRLFEQKPHWIDIDAGELLAQTPMDDLARRFHRRIVAVASGEYRTHNETNGFREIAIFKDGVTL